MRRKRTVEPQPYPFEREDTFENLDDTREFRVYGDNGWYHFIALVHNDEGQRWVDCAGGTKGRKMLRSFDLSKLRRNQRGVIVTRKHVTE